ncbi:enoyl-CoA hydratase/isomerase family protein [Bradymonas sediminis]|uniref:Enoyl-CoA hydratase/isomerase family protein n=2 Tax=Bradymonas sediminis TaxID=1548548 RepID=A0A2Z4FRP9_9DELT|nr:enoyl-CoA hydratase/isomerase family protein [Bradymonas sediminis]
MTFKSMLLEERTDQIAVLTVNRPDQLNAINRQVIDDLSEVVDKLKDRDDIRALVLTGAGRAFVAGADIKEMTEFGVEVATAFSQKGHDAMGALATLPFPVIAAVNGFALGGGLELAMACDFIYASSKARLGLPEVTLGVIPGFGGTQRLGRIVGFNTARELLFTGRVIKADEALKIGLAADVFEADEFMEKVFERVAKIAANGALAVRSARQVMRLGAETTLEEGNALEVKAFGELFGTADRKEGMEAFVAKRAPNFIGE